jgi:hypothetical protein
MKRQVILIRLWMLRLFTVLGIIVLTSGCTPTHDWREVRSDEGGWVALFPGKPVEVARTITLPDLTDPLRLTLQSARIGETMFAVGWTESATESVRVALEAAMLNNLQAVTSSVQRKNIAPQSQAMVETSAEGLIKTDRVAPAVKATLWMRSLVRQGARPRVIEIVAVGPHHELSEEAARQFIESLKFLD